MRARGLLITLIGVMFVVPDSLFIRLIDAPALEISFWRNLWAGLLLLGFVLLCGGSGPGTAIAASGGLGWIYLVAVGGSGVLFTLAVSLTSVANVVFITASMPVFAAVFSRVFLGEPIEMRMAVTIAAVLAGLLLILYGSGETEGASLAGDIVALCVSALFAGALTVARALAGVSLVPLVPVAYVGSAVALLGFVWPFALEWSQVGLVLLHGTFIAVSSAGLALGPRYLPSAEVALLILLESVLAPLPVWVWLGEDPGGFALLGGALIVCALAASNIWALRRG